MMMRPPGFICLIAACVATSVPRTLMSITPQLLLELCHESRIDLDLLCHLLRIADDRSLEIGEKRVGRVVGQRSELLLRHSSPLPEGRVVRQSIVTTIDL